MRRAANVDACQREAVKRLRQIGASVQPLHTVGSGVPDLLVGWRGVNVLVELKNGEKHPTSGATQRVERLLNAKQKEWIAAWAGQVCVADSPEDAVLKVIEIVNGLTL